MEKMKCQRWWANRLTIKSKKPGEWKNSPDLKYYNKIFEENDLPRIRFHDLRHTYATLLLTNNHGVKAVSELLGHGSTIITTKVYFDKSKVIIDCSEKMNDYVNRVIPKEEKKSNEILLNNLDTNLIASKYL